MTTRFPSGLTTAKSTEPFSLSGFLDPTKWHVFIEDFDSRDIALATPTNWTVTKVGLGTVAESNTQGAGVLITNAAADNDSVAAQVTSRGFAMTDGKKAIFEARLKVSNATQSDIFMGISVNDTTPIGAAASEETGVADGIFFLKVDGSTEIEAHVRDASSTTFSKDTGLGTMADDTFVSVAWAWNGKEEMKLYVNGVHKGTFAAKIADLPASTIVMSVNMMLQNGDAVARNMTVDRVIMAMER